MLEIIAFLGQSFVLLIKGLCAPKHFRFSSVVRHIDEIGIDAIPIICLIAFLISVVLAYQGAGQLRRVGAEQFTADLVGISVLREMGVLLTAIMVAGRSGSAFTAEIGVMKVREEVDALRVIGINPFEVLVMPRLIALIITLPILTFLANIMGLFGGAVMSMSLLDLPLPQYMDRIRHAAQGSDFYVGMIKAPVFAFLIGVVGCMHGMKVDGSAESVGQRTTKSVVHSIFLVLVMDAFFSILFSKLGI
jgi:phospholipid/cholesterol/gamma-HCH transport system permease protein